LAILSEIPFAIPISPHLDDVVNFLRFARQPEVHEQLAKCLVQLHVVHWDFGDEMTEKSMQKF
jgi:hypothetical protein